MKKFLIVLIVISVLSFSITKEDILKTSRENIERAVKLLKIYIAQHPDENVEDIGKIVFVKKKLSSDPFIGEAVVKEDFDALLKGLVEKGNISKELFDDLKVIFNFKDELEKRLSNLDENALKVCNIVGRYIKVSCNGIAKKIVEEYVKNPLKFDPKPYLNLACIDKNEIKKALSTALEEKFKEGEKYYLKIWTLAEILNVDFPHLKDLKEYSNLSMDIDEALRSGVSKEEYDKLMNRLNNLKVEKSYLEKKMENLKKMIYSPEKPQRTNSTTGKPIITYIAVTVVSAAAFFIILLLLDSRHNVKRIKRKIEKDPLNPDLHIRLAELYERIGRLEDAMEEYKIASKLSNSKEKNKEND